MRIGSLVMRVEDLQRGADFWSQALHYGIRGGGVPQGGCPVLEGPGDGPSLTLDTDDRFHLDLHVDSAAEQAAEIERLLALGAQEVEWRYAEGADHVVLADPEGNLFCIVNTGRDDSPASAAQPG
jgi:catechol 2,3-dioxygenase-like lactoylglutathione lyase family enzyme